jgi:hypothetical protein
VIKKLFLLVCILLMTESPLYSKAVNSSTQSEKVEYMYPANKEKEFNETVDQFYLALRKRAYPVHQEFYKKHKEFYKRHKNKYGEMDTALFKEMPDASVSIRKKVLFNEVEGFNYITWDGNSHYTYPDLDLKYHQTVSPDRQVYFFYSFKDTEKEFRGRYAVYDVETKKLLAGGGTFFPKYPIYKNNLKTSQKVIEKQKVVAKPPKIISFYTDYPVVENWVKIPNGTKKLTFNVKADNTETILFWLVPTGTQTWYQRKLIGYDIKGDVKDNQFSFSWMIDRPSLLNHLQIQALGEGIASDSINLIME